mgnify:CR=1 FL=1
MDTVFFWASKLIWALISPDSLLLLFWLAGFALLLCGALRPAKLILGCAAGIALVVALLPLGDWVILPLESRFAPLQDLPEQVDGIIVLGGFLDSSASQSWQQTQSNQAAERLWAFTALARQYPDAQLLFSGGSAALTGQSRKEADQLPALLREAGLGARGLLLEDQSRNTYENVLFSKALAKPLPQQRWILITSAAHMPRSVGIFCAQQWPVLPYPVDFRSDRDRRWSVSLRFAEHLHELSDASREWIGLLAYFLTGKTVYLLPGQSSECVLSG